MRSMNKKEYKKKWCETHKNEISAYNKQWHQQHREEILAHKKLYRERNRDKVLASSKRWREQNKEKERQSVKAWRENHIEQYREIMRKHSSKRQRKLGFIPLNKPFEGSEAHHICRTFVIYIPKDMHRSIYHSVWTGKNMEEINKLAWEELYKQRATDTLGCI